MADNQFLGLDGFRYLWEKISNTFVKKNGKQGLSDNNYSDADKTKLDNLSNYELPAADENTLGGVKVGTGLSIDEDNKLHATYKLPQASSLELGGIRIGAGLQISSDGVVEMSMPPASATKIGGVRIGSGLTVDAAGTLSTENRCEWQNVTDKPNTLSGYGISDGVTKSELQTYTSQVTEIKTEMASDNIRDLLLPDDLPGTSQQIMFTANGNVDRIVHTSGSTTVRTDVYTFSGNTITEVRTLSTGQKLTIVTNTETLVTTITYAAA